ncbi:DUF421 domain-containing protein [Hymenobacter bucti]|uniref:DUF421 domain-containing protein n=1 Tax=Hymenobacter bucti TaxID=1844114 RepID=A0ABW4QTR8_9BACT
MKKEDISFGDWHRWLFGDAPPAFMGEVLLRALVMFVAVLLLMRLMGRRMKGEISVAELAVVLTFGAIIGGAMHQPKSGLLPGLAVLGAVLFMHRFTNWLAHKYHAVEVVEQGDAVLLLRDGVLDLAAMQQQALSQEQLFGLLRNENISQLGELRRVYFEVSGELSLYQLPTPVPGLSVRPPADAPTAALDGPAQGKKACATCGQVPAATDHAGGSCLRCGAANWQPAAWQAPKAA